MASASVYSSGGSSTTSASTGNTVVWNNWCDDTNATSIGSIVWKVWASSGTTSNAITSTVSDGIWVTWNVGSVVKASWNGVPAPTPETEVERTARVAREAEHTQRMAQQRAEWDQKEAEKLQRANDLLVTMLNANQLRDWQQNKWFDVQAQSGKRFRIHNQPSHNVDEYDGSKRVAKHCIVPIDCSIPLPDQLVVQKLMLEHNEAEFMRIANHSLVTD